jgi:LysR family glycine cleavage system transcriptional activator
MHNPARVPKIMEFPVSSADCRLLLLLESKGSLRDVAQQLGRDISVVSRQIARISETAPLVEKIDGKWQVSNLGKQFTAWARDSIVTQELLLKSRTHLRIVTTREFAARVLAPSLSELSSKNENVMIEILSPPGGIEGMLLKGEADIGFDCGIPRDPSVKFQRIAPETFIIVASPQFLKRWPTSTFQDLLKSPHLQVQSRLSASKLLQLETQLLNPLALFHDIAAARAACVAGCGWALLPTYTVRDEIKAGALLEIRGKGFPKMQPESFGVWWLRERRAMDAWVTKLTGWLKNQKLN